MCLGGCSLSVQFLQTSTAVHNNPPAPDSSYYNSGLHNTTEAWAASGGTNHAPVGVSKYIGISFEANEHFNNFQCINVSKENSQLNIPPKDYTRIASIFVFLIVSG